MKQSLALMPTKHDQRQPSTNLPDSIISGSSSRFCKRWHATKVSLTDLIDCGRMDNGKRRALSKATAGIAIEAVISFPMSIKAALL